MRETKTPEHIHPHPKPIPRWERVQWQILTTPPLSGQENMDYDRATFQTVEASGTAVLRFFRFREPTVTYGRLQKEENIRPLTPKGWAAVQRPTGGGVVFHQNDLCLSLCWRKGQAPIPVQPREQYRWIHTVIRDALKAVFPLQMAACGDGRTLTAPFTVRECFKDPVGYDLLLGRQKKVGGALYHSRAGVLYQGTLQEIDSLESLALLQNAFEARLFP